jgi:hypothetical protein
VSVRVRLLFVDEGAFHDEIVRIPQDLLDRHERLIDCLQEEAGVLKELHVDLGRLCAAFVEEDATS